MRPYKRLVTLLFVLFTIMTLCTHCGASEADDTNDTTEPSCKQVGTASQVTGDAKYRFTVSAKWSESTHPDAYPGASAHFTTFAGAAHNSDFVVFKTGEPLSTPGVETLVEEGSINAFKAEVEKQVSNNKVKEFLKLVEFRGDDLTNSQCFEFWATTAYSNFSVISMVAPTSDWFIGLSSIALREGDTWKFDTEKTFNARVYDAGTEKDTKPFNLVNADENPKLAVSLESSKFQSGELTVGTFSLKLVEVKEE